MKNLLFIALVAASSSARADTTASKAAYEAGEQAYNTGDLPKAIELFNEAYAQQPDAAFIYDIAQVYRQAGNCEQALSSYKRFLWLASSHPEKPMKPEVKAEVEGRIAELEACVKPAAAPAAAPVAHSDEKDDDGDDEPARTVHEDRPRLVVARVGAGVAKVGAGDLDTPIQLALAVVAGYPIKLAPKAELDVGPALMFTPLPYSAASGPGTGSLFAIAADAGASYTVIPNLALRGDLAVGVQALSGIDKSGNPFTVGGAPATGPLAMFYTRLAVSADYAVTPDVVITATPLALSYSPTPGGFMSSIPSLTTVSFLIGVGYRK